VIQKMPSSYRGSALICQYGNTASRADPARAIGSSGPLPGSHGTWGHKVLLSPRIPAYPRSGRKAMPGLSRRRSRVRVPSLPLSHSAWKWDFLLPV
jgi:hypothetical protein